MARKDRYNKDTLDQIEVCVRKKMARRKRKKLRNATVKG